MKRETAHRLLTVLIAAVWIAFGLYCKVLDLVPRHEEIVARILGESHAAPLTRTIGGLEVLLGLWVLSGVARRLCALTQIVLVATMNLLEAWLAPDLLLWGRLNVLVAVTFIAVIWVNEWELGGRTRR